MASAGEMLYSSAPDLADLGHFCTTDPWQGELETGLFQLNGVTRQILDLPKADGYGLLSLVQCFDPADQHRLVALFEQAASTPTQFSFATTVARGGKSGQAVYCIGRSAGQAADGDGSLAGVFIFPHL